MNVPSGKLLVKRASALGLLAMAVVIVASGCSTTKSAPEWMGDLDSSSRPGLKTQNAVSKSSSPENWEGANDVANLLQTLVK